MEELLSAGMLATLHQCAHDGVALRRQSMSALAQPAHAFIHAASHDADCGESIAISIDFLYCRL